MSEPLVEPRHRHVTRRTRTRAQVLRAQMTEAESALWSLLAARQLEGLKFRRQHPVEPFIADFYCHEARLVVEVDGATHDDKVEADASRTRYLESKGLKVIRFSDQQVFRGIQHVRDEIARVARQRASRLHQAPPPTPPREGGEPEGFTLIELLVVVTIIVVLLALLVPAMDKAIYQAELTVCGTNQKGIADGMNIYALDHKRTYPHRQSVHVDDFPAAVVSRGAGTSAEGAVGATTTGRDDRDLLRPYISLNGHGNCPLTGEIDIDGSKPSTVVFLAYDLWAGFRYVGDRGALRMGQKLVYSYASGSDTYDVLVGDGNIFNNNDTFSHNTHPDTEGLTTNQVTQDTNVDGFLGLPSTRTRWIHPTSQRRGPVDLNFARHDGSVTRYDGVRWDDEDFSKPLFGPTYFANKGAPEWEHRLPLR